ncbi:MAG: pilus assembly protein [Candidatus Dormibacteraeota bacterium]|nr:pilus assembly protein [Candidatus Dormibacteraeota bacterium]
MVEFAITIGVFLLMLFGAVEASLYAFERSAAVTAVADAARVAAGGSSSGGAAGINSPDLQDALATAVRVARPSMPGTNVRSLAPGQPCPDVSTLADASAVVCAISGQGQVTVTLRARPRTLVPDVLGLGWSVDVGAEVHEVVFSR